MPTRFALVAGFALALLTSFSALGGLSRVGQQPIKYYVQLIRGNDSDQPPVPGAKPAGPKLDPKLRAVFKWKSYWDINRQVVKLGLGEKAKVRLAKDREVEIDLSEAGMRKVTAFRDEKPVASTKVPQGEAMTIIGGDRDPKSVWFIVVRRDEPHD